MTRRVLVALDDGQRGRSLVETAVRLAAKQRAELVGLYIEEQGFLDALSLPFVRTLRDTQRGWEQAQPGDLERAFRLRAETLRSQLQTAAQASGLSWRFTVLRGTPAERISETVTKHDTLVIGAGRTGRKGTRFGSTARRLASRAETTLLVLRSISGGSVLAVFDGDTRVLLAAAELAGTYGLPLMIAIVPGQREPGTAVTQRRARDWMQRHHLQAEIHVLSENELETTGAALQALRPTIAVLRRNVSADGDSNLVAILEQLDCTIFLVSEHTKS